MKCRCVQTFLNIAVSFLSFEMFCYGVKAVDEVKVVSLPNEKCRIRPELVTVGSAEDFYYPVIISLYRCGGACPDHQFRKCIVQTSNNVLVSVFNEYTNSNESKTFQNHTSCSCKCVHNTSVCSKTLGTTWN